MSTTKGCLTDIDIKNNTTAVDITAIDGQLMLLPQLVDDTDKILVTTTMNGTLTSKEASLKKLIPNFEAGKRYTITIKVITKVDVDITCTVQPWTVKIIDVPEFN